MRSARGDDENRRDRSPYFSNRSLQAKQDLESKRGRTLAGSPSPGALRTASLMGEGRRPGEYASDIPHAMTANLAVSDREDCDRWGAGPPKWRSEEHTSELQSLTNLVCRLLLEQKK